MNDMNENLESLENDMNESLDNVKVELDKEVKQLNESKKAKEHINKETMILKAKLEEVKQQYKKEMQELKQKIRNDIRKAESYFAFVMLRAMEDANDTVQEQIASILYDYIIKLNNSNKKEVARAKQYTETMKYSNKKVYLTLSSLLDQVKDQNQNSS